MKLTERGLQYPEMLSVSFPVAFRFCLGLMLAVLSFSLSAAITVRMETVFGNVDIELLDDIAPLTVQNFLNYVDDGDYTDSFIHRNGVDSNGETFVVQGGGFTFDPDLGPFIRGQGIQDVPEDPPVQNEFQLSNLRGTIAMAKIGSDPNSATSQWFVNVLDNTFLDEQNSGFTVFARVLGDGMDIIDQIAAVPIQAFFQPFNELPLVDFTAGQPIGEENVVFVRRVFRLGILESSVQSLDMGKQQAGGTSLVRSLKLSLTGSEGEVTIGDIGAGGLEAPFSVVDDKCSGVVLGGSSGLLECELSVRFAPSDTGDFSGSLIVPSDSVVDLVPVNLAGSGTAAAVAAVEATTDQIDFGSQPVGSSELREVSLLNIGGTSLVVTVLDIEGDAASEFSAETDCSATVPGQSCTVFVTFSPTGFLETDTAEATLSVDTPGAELELSLTLNGQVVSGDTDTVSDAVEDGHPSKNADGRGDGNGDGIADALQANVVSLPNAFGEYVTLEASNGATFDSILALTLEQLLGTDNPPEDLLPPSGFNADVTYDHGFFVFQLGNVSSFSNVTMTLPADARPRNYAKFRTFFVNGQQSADWILFDFDGTVGAEFQDNKVILHLVDGAFGDGDFTVNGRIVDPGGPAFVNVTATSESGSGSFGCVATRSSRVGLYQRSDWLVVFLFVSMLAWRRINRKSR